MKDSKDTRRGGFYWKDGKPYVSVTKVLTAIPKPALQYWFGKQIYLAMVANPALSEAEAMASPYQTSDKAKSRGTTIHSLIEALKNGAKVGKVPKEFAGYKKAFETWMKDIKPKILENEKTAFNEKEKYAGTLDMLARIGRRNYVIDFKTSKSGETYMEAELQVAAYSRASKGFPNAIVVGLGENGQYTQKNVVGIKTGYRTFLSVKKLWEFLNRDDCKKIGYGTN